MGSSFVSARAAAGALAVGLPALAAAPVQAGAQAEASGSLTLLPSLAIRSNHDLVLAAILLRGAVRQPDVAGGRPGGPLPAGLAGISQNDAAFIVVGQPDQVVSVAVPASFVLTRTDGDEIVRVETIALAAGDSPTLLSRDKLGGDGVLRFSVRGQLAARPVATPGRYTGLLAATAQYN